MSNLHLESQLQISNIESNKKFQRLADVTQVSTINESTSEMIKTRLTHSYEVSTSASILALSIEKKLGWESNTVDYQGSVRPASLLHDIGHACFGHSAATILDDTFKKLGLEEGFCDNANNLTVIEKNQIMVSDYTLASVIKYFDRLYPYQKEAYQPIMEKALEDDRQHFSKLGIELEPQSQTIACQIMDEADRNSYICSDLADYLCLGNTLSIKDIMRKATKRNLALRHTELNAFFAMVKSGSKTAIKAYFNNLKNKLNMNYVITNNGLDFVNKDLVSYREFLWLVEWEYYIKPIAKNPSFINNMENLKRYISCVINEGHAPSSHYQSKISKSNDDIEKLRYQRDMIGETTDAYINRFSAQALLQEYLSEHAC